MTNRTLILRSLAAMVMCVACARTDTTAPSLPPVTPADTAASGGPPAPPVPSYTYEFGARFEPPVGRVVHGMGQWVDGNPQYLALLPNDKRPAAELTFVQLVDDLRPWDPAKIAAGLNALHAAGRIPVMDLALRGNQPTLAQYNAMADKTWGADSLVAFTSQYDARIQEFINVLKAYGAPVMLRIGAEFSGWWEGYHPYVFPVAFRKIVNMFRASGVNNVAFIWCYEPAAANDFDAVDASGNARWFPGDDVVDWFSIDLFASNDISGPATGHGEPTAFGRTMRFLDMAVAHHRPVIIAESSPMQFNLGDPAQASASWSQWFNPYWSLIASRSEIKWFHYINYDWTKASYYGDAGWKNNDLSASASLAAQYVAEVTKPRYLHANEVASLKGWISK